MKVFFTSRISRVLLFCGAVIAVALAINIAGADELLPRVAAQTDRFLESRLSTIEQRFYGLESRVNRVEQSSLRSVLPSATQPDNSTEMQFLRSQVDSLRTRVGELECAVLKLDERTLTAAEKARRSRAAGQSDVCRQAAAGAVQLSARP